MNQITLDAVIATAKPGDIIIGRFPTPIEHAYNPIILIGSCVMCALGKEEILEGIAFYLEQQDDKYIKYEVVR